MRDGYGQIFLILLTMGLIFLGASGKGKAVWDIIVGNNLVPTNTSSSSIGTVSSSTNSGVNYSTPTIKNYEDAQTGGAGVRG